MSLAGLQPLRHRSFALFWGAGATSDIGTWVQLAAIGALVAAESGSALATALVAAATFAPQGIASPVGGVLADRFDRRKLFLATLGLQTVWTAVLAMVIASGQRSPAVLSLLVLAQSASGALGGPALQAILPDLVPKAELTAALALGITGWNAGRVLGPLLAALLVPVGTQWAVGANAMSFAALWVAIFGMRRSFLPANPTRRPMRVDLADGARALVRTRGPLVAVLTMVALHLTLVPFMGLVPATGRALAERSTGAGGAVTDTAVAHATSWLFSAQGAGAIVGALAVASLLQRVRRSRVVAGALTVAAAMAPLHVLAPSLPLAALAIAVLGAASATTFASMAGVVQRDAPAAHRGRVLSWWQGAMGLTYGLGLWLLGSSADRWGLPTTFAVTAVGVAAFAGFIVRTCRWARIVDAEAGAEPAVPVPAAVAAAVPAAGDDGPQLAPSPA